MDAQSTKFQIPTIDDRVRLCKATATAPMIDSVRVAWRSTIGIDLHYYGAQGCHPFLGNEVVGEVKAVEIDTSLAEPICPLSNCTQQHLAQHTSNSERVKSEFKLRVLASCTRAMQRHQTKAGVDLHIERTQRQNRHNIHEKHLFLY